MPELPEVETVTRGLQDLVGKRIDEINIHFPQLRYPLSAAELNQARTQTIKAIKRRAKYILIELEAGHLIFHLGMSGRITLYNTTPPPLIKHDHVELICEQFTLRYNDPRRFGCLVYCQDLNSSPLLTKLGPEPLSADFTADYLLAKLKNRTSPIKPTIMDNSIVVGVGNIYACEALFLSKISPLRPANRLTLSECELLIKNIRQVLTAAIKAGGSSLRDYKNADGELGYFQFSHNVYGKTKQACLACGTPICAIRLGQRNSFYCPSCQH